MALIFTHRASAASEIAFRPAADIFRFLAGLAAGVEAFPALILAHRAFWNAAILARPAAEILRFAGLAYMERRQHGSTSILTGP